MKQSQLTLTQQEALARAKAEGRALVTMIDGHVAIILTTDPDDTPELARIAEAIWGVLSESGPPGAQGLTEPER